MCATRFLPLVFLLTSLEFGCSRAEIDDPALSSAIEQTLDALRKRDLPKLWSLTDEATQKALLDEGARLQLALQKVPEVWPEADVEAALKALGADRVSKLGDDGQDRGARLLDAFLDTSRLTFDEGTLEGLAARDLTYDAGPPRRALILTTAGERLTFVQHASGWKSLVLREHLLDSGPFKLLVEHAHKTLALFAEAHQTWVSSTDPALPQGAYNLARAAQSRNPPDLDMLFALLGTDGREALKAALEDARKAQKQIQQKVARPERRAAYDAARIGPLIELTSDRDLFRLWLGRPETRPLMASVAPPDRLEGKLDSGAVTLITTDGSRIDMRRDADAIWRLGGLGTTITAAFPPAAL